MYIPFGIDILPVLVLTNAFLCWFATGSLLRGVAGAVVGFAVAITWLKLKTTWLLARINSNPALQEEGATPTVVIIVPGLNVPPLMAWTMQWIWYNPAVAPDKQAHVIEVRSPWPWYWPYGDLGTPLFLQAVRDVVAAQPKDARIWLVGSLRGAGVVLGSARMIIKDERIKRVVMLNGPYLSITNVLRFRYGRWLAKLVHPVVSLFCGPETMLLGRGWETDADRASLFRFVTSAADTSVPPENVRFFARKLTDKDPLLLKDAPHSIAWASDEDKLRVREYVWNKAV